MRSEDPESHCLALAKEGERLIRARDLVRGIELLEQAIEVGTKSVQLLSAIYSQLGNAYFATRNYSKALQFHHNDLLLTKLMKDPAGEAKACGNLGNTYKAIAKYDDAVYFCQSRLRIAKHIEDKICISRALYNMATVYHAKGQSKRSKEDLNKAVDLYQENLENVEDLVERGRTYGNLGNVYYLLGNYETAVDYHQKRLEIARQFGDQIAMRRACSNLGNCLVFMSKLDDAVKYFKMALKVTEELGDRVGEAQVCFNLGNAVTIQSDFDSAIDYHLRHLRIARDLKDRAGEARVCASLADNFENKKDLPKALYFRALTRKLALEMQDRAMEITVNDQIKQMLKSEAGSSLVGDLQMKIDDSADPHSDRLRTSRENMVGSRSMPDLLSASLQSLIMDACLSNGTSATPLELSFLSSTSVDCGLSRTSANDLFNASKMSKQSTSTSTKDRKGKKGANIDANEDFFDFLSRMQSKRIDDQRCDPVILNDVTNRAGIRQSDNISIAAGISESELSASALSTKANKSRRKSIMGRLKKSFSRQSAGAGVLYTPVTVSDSMSMSLERSFAPPVTSTPLNRPAFRNENRPSLAISFISEETDNEENNADRERNEFRRTPRVNSVGEDLFRVPMLPPPRKKRMNENKDRRLSLDPKMLNDTKTSNGPEAILDLIALIQGRRMEEQRAHLVLPGLNNPEQLLEKLNDGGSQAGDAGTFDAEHLYEMVLKCQSDRLEDQRSELGGKRSIPEEDISRLVLKMQAGRLEEQRAHLSGSEPEEPAAQEEAVAVNVGPGAHAQNN